MKALVSGFFLAQKSSVVFQFTFTEDNLDSWVDGSPLHKEHLLGAVKTCLNRECRLTLRRVSGRQAEEQNGPEDRSHRFLGEKCTVHPQDRPNNQIQQRLGFSSVKATVFSQPPHWLPSSHAQRMSPSSALEWRQQTLHSDGAQQEKGRRVTGFEYKPSYVFNTSSNYQGRCRPCSGLPGYQQSLTFLALGPL